MKLWATRDSSFWGDDICLWRKKPHNKPAPDAGRFFWYINGGKVDSQYWSFNRDVFKTLFGCLPRRDRPMRITLTGRVAK